MPTNGGGGESLETNVILREKTKHVAVTQKLMSFSLQRYQKFFAANDPDVGGSFYLQSKIYRAKEAMEYSQQQNLEDLEAAKQPKKEEES